MKRSQHVVCVTILPKSDDAFRMSSNVAHARHHIHKKDFTIGSSKRADLIINNKAIAPFQLRVLIQDGGIYLENMDENFETLVSGKTLNGKNFPYKGGETIQLGGFDNVLSIDIYHRELKPTEIKEDLVKEATSYAENIKKEAQELLKSAQAKQVQVEQIINQAKTDADNIRTQAQRKYEEKIREAIEEGQSQAHGISNKLTASAKSEIQSIIRDATAQAEKIIEEGKSQKTVALHEKSRIENEIEALKLENEKLQEEKQKLVSQYEQEVVRKSDLESSIIEIQRQQETFKEELHFTLATLEKKQSDLTKVTFDLEKNLTALKQTQEDEQRSVEKRTQEEELTLQLKEKNDTLTNEMKNLELKVSKIREDLTHLHQREQVEVERMQEKAEREYERQKKLEHARMMERLEHLYRHNEKLEHERRDAQIKQLSADILQQLLSLLESNRSMHLESFFVDNLKNQVPRIVAKSVEDEFQFRKNAAFTPPSRVKRWVSIVAFSAFAGVVSLYLLFAWISSQGPQRNISSVFSSFGGSK